MVFNFYLAGGFFLRNRTDLPWPIRKNITPDGLIQEEKRCALLLCRKLGDRAADILLHLKRWFISSDPIWSQGVHNVTLNLCCPRESSHHRDKNAVE